MKKLFFVFAILIGSCDIFAANEYFRSIASGNWNSTSTWQMSTNSGSTWITATSTPSVTSGLITIQSPNTVTVSSNVSADQLVVNGGATLSISSLVTLTINDGAGEDLILNNPGIISGAGKIETNGSAVVFNLHGGGVFSTTLRVVSGITTLYDNLAPRLVTISGNVIIENNTVLNTAIGPYTTRFTGAVQNYGTLTTGSGGSLRFGGSFILNNDSISGSNIYYESALNISGTGKFSGNTQIVTSSGSITLGSNVTFSALTMTMNFASTVNLNGYSFKFIAGSFTMRESTSMTSGSFITEGNITLIVRSTALFSTLLINNSGTLTLDNDTGNDIILSGGLTNSSSLSLSLVINLELSGTFVNSGTVSGSGAFRFKGNSFTNSGTIANTNFILESGSHSISGIGTWSTSMYFLNGSNTTLSGNFQVRDIIVNPTAILNLSSHKLILKGTDPLSISGTVNSSTGTIEFNGSASQNINASILDFYRLSINNSAGVNLQTDITVTDTLSLVSGDINLNGKIIDLSSTGYLKETSGNTVKGSSGYIVSERVLNSPVNDNVAGLGAVITTAAVPGITIVKRGHTIQASLNGGGGLMRYYDIIPENNTNLNATLVFSYDDTELNSNDESSLALFRSPDDGVSWSHAGGIVSISDNKITLTSIGSFSRWSADEYDLIPSTIKIFPEAFLNPITNTLNSKDTIRIFLRESSAPYNIVDSAKSEIDSVTFTGSFLFQNAPSGTYYLMAIHRNSLETWSKAGGESYNTGSAFNYDFTDDSTKAYGNNMHKTNSMWGIISGDVNRNGNVTLTDIIDVYNSSATFESGYIAADVNGDKNVNLNDILAAFNNSAMFSQAVTP